MHAYPQNRGRSGMRQRAAMDVQPAQFGAAMQLREDLAGVEQPVGIERAFEALLMGEVGFVEHRRPSGRAFRRRRRARRSGRRRPRRRAAGCRRRIPRPARSRPAGWRRRGSAGADCRRRRGTRWRRAARMCSDRSRIRAAPRPGGRAGSCRPCSNNRARCGRPPGTPPCARPRTPAARPRRG